jgi:hypothetical protein
MNLNAYKFVISSRVRMNRFGADGVIDALVPVIVVFIMSGVVANVKDERNC